MAVLLLVTDSDSEGWDDPPVAAQNTSFTGQQPGARQEDTFEEWGSIAIESPGRATI
jgi:hypothetical protein